MKSKTYPVNAAVVRLRVAMLWLRVRYLPRLLSFHYTVARRYTPRRRAMWIAVAFGWHYMNGR